MQLLKALFYPREWTWHERRVNCRNHVSNLRYRFHRWFRELVEPRLPDTYVPFARFPNMHPHAILFHISDVNGKAHYRFVREWRVPFEIVTRRSWWWPWFKYHYLIAPEPARNSHYHVMVTSPALVHKLSGVAMTPREIADAWVYTMQRALEEREQWYAPAGIDRGFVKGELHVIAGGIKPPTTEADRREGNLGNPG